MASTPHRLHLIRHGEVLNPDHLVYAGLPGFGLSARGIAQATAAADWLRRRRVVAVISSPLQRATETAAPIAAVHGIEVDTDADLTEWELSNRWAGHPWPRLPEIFPGELEAYLSDPSRLPFSPESLHEVGKRVADSAEACWAQHPTPGDIVVVSHQDPVESARRRLTGRDLSHFNAAKPAHGSVITFAPQATGWREISVFTPPQT
jgi:broad specificity phosphatase PhoE